MQDNSQGEGLYIYVENLVDIGNQKYQNVDLDTVNATRFIYKGYLLGLINNSFQGDPIAQIQPTYNTVTLAGGNQVQILTGNQYAITSQLMDMMSFLAPLFQEAITIP